MKKVLLLSISFAFLSQLNAQTPHKDLGIKEDEMEYLTLSDGRYDEYHGYRDFERVGSAIIDMKTRKVLRFIDKDSISYEGMLDVDMTTRFLTSDPLAEKYFEMSPYGYCANNPILFIDPDGQRIDLSHILATDKNGSYKNEELAQAFLAFAKTDLGQGFLKMFAEKGQKIDAIGLEFAENGSMHEAGMDLNFRGESKGENGANGEWQTITKDDGRTEGIVILNSDLNGRRNDDASDYSVAKVRYKYNNISKEELEKAKTGYVASRAGTIVHELSIHGIYDMMSLKNGESTLRSGYEQHINARKNGSFFRENGLPAAYQIHKLLKTGKAQREIKATMFNYKN